jgi:UDP-N-acetylmuramate--alanine ligase
VVTQAIKTHGHKDVTLVKDLKEVPAWLKERAKDGDMVITMGAGNVYKAGEEFLKQLQAGG